MRTQAHKALGFATLGLAALGLVTFLVVNKLSLQLVSHRFDLPPAPLPAAWPPASPPMVARGQHLVQGILGCTGCHGADLAGRLLCQDSAGATISSANLTQRQGALGDPELVLALRYGLREDGRALWLMPQRALGHLTDGDLRAVVAALRTLAPVAAENPVPRLGLRGRWGLALKQTSLFDLQPLVGNTPGIDPPATDLVPTASAAYGGYLARIGRCISCHGGAMPAALPGKLPWLGGQPLEGPLRGRDPAALHAALVAGLALDGSPLPAGVQGHRFAALDPLEASALWAFYAGAAAAAPAAR